MDIEEDMIDHSMKHLNWVRYGESMMNVKNDLFVKLRTS